MKVKLSLSILIVVAGCLDNAFTVKAELTNFGFDVDPEADASNSKSHVITDDGDALFPANANDAIYQEGAKDSQRYPESKDLFWKRQITGTGDSKVYGFWKKRSNQSGFWKRQGPQEATSGFWKRGPHVDDVAGFWKRQYDGQNDGMSNFWKRDSDRQGSAWVASNSDSPNDGEFASKRSYDGRPMDAGASFWKRGQPEMSQFWKRSGGDGSQARFRDGGISGFWKRGGVPWNLMMLPEYRDRLYKSDLSRYPHPAGVKQGASGLEPLPPMNRRRGPKHNPDFNPTGW